MRSLCLSILAAGMGSHAFASVIRVDFQGTVFLSGFSSVSVGDTFTGSFFYSSPDLPFATNPNFCGSPGACVVDQYNVPVAFQITVDGSTISTTNLAPAYIQVQDSVTAGPNDRVDVNSGAIPLLITGPLAAERSAGFDLVLIDFAGPTSLFSSPQIPAMFPSLGAWSTEAAIDFATYSSFGSPARQFAGNITQLSMVPEPSTLIPLILSLCLGISLWKSKQNEHSRNASLTRTNPSLR
jgi:hypothetical protein